MRFKFDARSIDKWESAMARLAKCSTYVAALLLFSYATLGPTETTAQTLRPGSPAWLERCKTWIERKGYPVDYIEQKTGKRQPGFASSWKGNIAPADLRPGDVAIMSLTMDDGRTVMGAAYVEEVEPAVGSSSAFITFTSMGLVGKSWVDQECFVGDTYGRVVRSRESVTRVLRAWRPSLPLE